MAASVLSSIDTNPVNADLSITKHATDWLWTVFALMLVFDIAAIFWSATRPVGQRFYHQVVVIILTVSTLAYLAMAADLGATPIVIEFYRGRPHTTTRQIWYVRYIEWTINAPLVLLELLLASGVLLSDIFITVFMALVIVICGLVGALIHSQYKWGFFVFGICAYFYVATMLLFHSRHNSNIGAAFHSSFRGSAAFLIFIWGLYPICWALSDGGNVISPTSEMVFYGLLDILSGPVWLFFFMWSIAGIEYGSFGAGRASNAGAGSASGSRGVGDPGAAEKAVPQENARAAGSSAPATGTNESTAAAAPITQ